MFKKSSASPAEKGAWRPWLILLAAVAGIALILFGGEKQEKTEETNRAFSLEEDEMILYQSYLEARVRELCRSVPGVGEVHAVVTLEGGFEAVYATELSDGDEIYVIVGSGANAAPLYLTRNAPKIAGIGVVTTDPLPATLRQELTQLLCATFALPSNHIHITGT